MEQNAIPGLANRTLGRWVDFAAVSDPRTQAYFGTRAVVTGNPIRPEFKVHTAENTYRPYTILVFGGSQGAQSINRAVMEALESLSDWKDRLRFVHQTGERQLEEVKGAYAARGFNADVRVFFNDFHQQYAAADLIVSQIGCDDGGGDQGRRPRGDSDSVSVCDRRSPDEECASAWSRKRQRC